MERMGATEATGVAFDDFLACWRLSDRRGTWGAAIEIEDGLRYLDTEGNDPEDFPRAGATSSGVGLYDLAGWVWVRI